MSEKNKKQIIIYAAKKIMAAKGYEKASIKEIAKEAEITSGLIHYYFKNKEEILTAVLMDACNQHVIELQNRQERAPSEDISTEAIRVPKEKVGKEPDWYKLRYELFAIGLRNSSHADGVNTVLEYERESISTILTSIFPESQEIESLASILLACFDGLALQKLLNPEFDLDNAYDVLQKLVLTLKDTR
ncbi:TetR/AcrR family transcriptional regulator [Jeotgalibacillus marinus]|uniref:TetR/AcrR family transcriptional regulator n=1 Tax=Jeotgalibacillus marinus TaxID=86667 RepID=A0ABV3Q418_9BACL